MQRGVLFYVLTSSVVNCKLSKLWWQLMIFVFNVLFSVFSCFFVVVIILGLDEMEHHLKRTCEFIYCLVLIFHLNSLWNNVVQTKTNIMNSLRHDTKLNSLLNNCTIWIIPTFINTSCTTILLGLLLNAIIYKEKRSQNI